MSRGSQNDVHLGLPRLHFDAGGPPSDTRADGFQTFVGARFGNYSIGTRTPLFFANLIASGYPASTCRTTPMPGSFVNTRSMRVAISFVPSATVTCPACCEYPMPTPPPLWMETQ